MEKNLILTGQQVGQKIKRMAFEVYEHNFQEKEVVFAGIDGQGYTLATLLAKQLEEISPIKAKVVKVSIDKSKPLQSEIGLDAEASSFKKKCVVVVDDVLNTGKTLAYAMKPFLGVEVKKIEVAVLINRSHSTFPIQPTYTGYGLSTTLTEHIEVILGKQAAVYLH
ncbi:MAG TPA: phosphoribosyltransferase family protein [Cyclobacteriaceae bacterium]